MQRSSTARRLVAAAGLAGALAIALTACGASGSGGTSPTSASSGSAAPVSKGASQVKVTLTGDNGDKCSLSDTSAKAGPVTFTVENQSSTAITEVELQSQNRILGEKENLAPGLAPVSFTLTLGGGSYQVYCPGADKEIQNFTVTGKAAAQPAGDVQSVLSQGTTGYASYVDGVVVDMVTATKNLQAAVDSGSLQTAQAKYALARPFYEKIESDVDGFVKPGFKATDNAGNLDYLIDMRASNLDPSVGWHGFHAIERDLFQAKAITPSTKSLAAELTSNVEELATLSKSLTYKPEDLANGAAGLLEEVQTEKVTGEEEAFSHYDLIDFAANVEGAQQAFAFLEPGMKKIDPALTTTINTQFTNVNNLLNTFRDPSQPGGFKIYTPQLREQNAATLSHAVQALQVPLSTIAEKVATAG
ncbi:iron uptake system protein EfeO [Gryllotalpicola reticulitermitis]|uniref:Iron uptake system protein EfeO n=1 Tax=Gryllotalpicola reticulitermitis TaxID=1184153 RepID=A0ABV8Q2G0_9MICO